MDQDQQLVGDSPPRQHEDRPWQRYRTAAVVMVGAGLSVTLGLALLGDAYLAVVWLACLLVVVSVIRLQRPDGSWVAARSRLFDAAFSAGLVFVLLTLASYAAIPRG